ncbi:MAG: hypothetical protein ABIP89_02465 [Polyangiaceae bacterium]
MSMLVFYINRGSKNLSNPGRTHRAHRDQRDGHGRIAAGVNESFQRARS